MYCLGWHNGIFFFWKNNALCAYPISIDIVKFMLSLRDLDSKPYHKYIPSLYDLEFKPYQYSNETLNLGEAFDNDSDDGLELLKLYWDQIKDIDIAINYIIGLHKCFIYIGKRNGVCKHIIFPELQSYFPSFSYIHYRDFESGKILNMAKTFDDDYYKGLNTLRGLCAKPSPEEEYDIFKGIKTVIIDECKYFVHDEYTGYACSSNGNIIRLKTGRIPKHTFNKDKDIVVHLYDRRELNKIIKADFAFECYHNIPNFMHGKIIHLNGNKNNFNYNNLASENTI